MAETTGTDDELREQLVVEVTRIITGHQLRDGGSHCTTCLKELYGEGRGSSLSRHRAERIVDLMDLVRVFRVAKNW